MHVQAQSCASWNTVGLFLLSLPLIPPFILSRFFFQDLASFNKVVICLPESWGS